MKMILFWLVDPLVNNFSDKMLLELESKHETHGLMYWLP